MPEPKLNLKRSKAWKARNQKRIDTRYAMMRRHRCSGCGHVYVCEPCSEAFANTRDREAIAMYPRACNGACPMVCEECA